MCYWHMRKIVYETVEYVCCLWVPCHICYDVWPTFMFTIITITLYTEQKKNSQSEFYWNMCSETVVVMVAQGDGFHAI